MEPHSGSSPNLLDRFLKLIENVPGSDRFLLRLAFFGVIAVGIWLLLSLNQQYSAITPTRGGTIIEGIIGTPRFINPALALTRADQDVTALVYSGLMKISTDGNLENDIAETINISEDGLTYQITLRQDVTFHDNTPLTAHDVGYTIQLIQNPDLKSPLRGNWTNVIIEIVNDYELNITLKEAYAPFIDNFTVGIMPAHLWSDLPIEQLPFSQLNTEPIGSGPFTISKTERDASGLIDHYSLSAFQTNRQNPKINQFKLAFFQNEEQLLVALQKNTIDATAYLSTGNVADILNTDQYQLVEEPLPRTFGIFFNQNRSTALRDPVVREAISVALNRDEIIQKTLHGYGVPMNGPIAFTSPALESSDGSTETIITQATDILKAGGWSKDEEDFWSKKIDKETVILQLTIRTSNTPLFESLIENISEQLKAVGIDVVTEQFEQSGLVQSVIRPRDFEALLFGLDMSRSYELYPFWHSSQQDDPGLNIAQYTNLEVDSLLEKARSEQSETTRLTLLNDANIFISTERPAIFLFQPTLTYIISNNMTIPAMRNIEKPSDRFNNAAQWHTESDSLWSMFQDET